MECFCPEVRLSLIDEAISVHKSLLPSITDTYKMDKWSAALERLLEQRRTEESKGNDSEEEELLSKFTNALENHAISTKTGRCIPGLPENQANTDVRVGKKRKD